MKFDNRDFLLLPKYKTIAGQRYNAGKMHKNDVRYRIVNTNVDEVYEYVSLLKEHGFAIDCENVISAGSEYSYNKNLFFCLKKQKLAVFIFFDANNKTIFITLTKGQTLPPKKISYSNNIGEKLTLTQINVNSGMCYVIKLSDGSFVVIDGGVYEIEDEKKLLDFIENNNKLEKPLISTWFITHAHVDHIQLATKFIMNNKDKVDIKAFAYQFPDMNKVSISMEDNEEATNFINNFEDVIKLSYPLAKKYTLHTGQKYSYNGIEVEVIYSPDDTFPFPQTSLNDLSVAFRILTDNEKIITILGDCMTNACRKMADTYGDYLKSDILQVAHHGLIGGDKRLYKYIDPQICFWPTPDVRFMGEMTFQRYQWCVGDGGCDYNAFLRDDSERKRTHYSHKNLITIDI